MAGRLGTSSELQPHRLPTHGPGRLTVAGLPGLGWPFRGCHISPDPSTQPQRRRRTADGPLPAFPRGSRWLPDTPAAGPGEVHCGRQRGTLGPVVRGSTSSKAASPVPSASEGRPHSPARAIPVRGGAGTGLPGVSLG